MRVILLVLLSLVLAWSVYASPKQQQPLPHTDDAQNHAKPDERGTEKAPLVIKVLPPPNEAEKAAADQQDRQDKSKSDWSLVGLTGILAIIGVIQIVVFSLQARRLRQTVDEMKIATSASEMATSATLKRQRAFVAFTSLEATVNKDYRTKRVTHWSFAPIWENAGDTPTRNMVVHVSIKPFDSELPEDWDFPDIWSRPDERSRTPVGISPHHSITGEALGASIQLIDEVIAGTKFLYVWGWAAYSDIFPNTDRHITRFAVRVVIGGNARDPNNSSLRYPFVKKYNCSDEECADQNYPASWPARPLREGLSYPVK